MQPDFDAEGKVYKLSAVLLKATSKIFEIKCESDADPGVFISRRFM